jgi:hypothetical protein
MKRKSSQGSTRSRGTGAESSVSPRGVRADVPSPGTSAAPAGTPQRGRTLDTRPPPRRRLRVYALDPSLALDFDTSGISAVTLEVPWGAGPSGGTLAPGPTGDLVEVIDADPMSERFYEPVDLNDPHLLAQDGHAPSDASPQFHQQMVYAVAMTTIRHFEDALGRSVLWGDRLTRGSEGLQRCFVQRLRIYPHALRGANAFYSPEKKALLFGYFPAVASPPAPERVPSGQTSVATGTMVFSCLSYDVVAHETAHALLDGLHPRYVEPTNPDMLAFHEAFADLVAIFQHFGHRELLRDVIARSRGDIGQAPLLTQLARQMGHALGLRGALRSALGEPPDAGRLERVLEPHDRGAVLVAAVFDAFLTIYGARVEDLLRIATDGTGVLRAGAIHPDLATRLAGEASTVAIHVLQMCIRALDYCPPVDLTFGDYLRALITADVDLVPYDQRNYRVAFLEAFRRRGIVPAGLRGVGEDVVRWRAPSEELADDLIGPLFDVLRDEKERSPLEDLAALWTLESDRRKVWEAANRVRGRLQRHIVDWPPDWAERELHVLLRPTSKRSVFTGSAGRPTTEVHSARVARRRGPRGETIVELVLEITQRRRGYLSASLQRDVDEGRVALDPGDAGDFRFRSGCTLLIDLAARRVRYAIRSSGPVDNDGALDRVRRRLEGVPPGARATYFGNDDRLERRQEPFALLHAPNVGDG